MEKFTKYDDGKPRWQYIASFRVALEEVCRIGHHGAEKYSLDNWKKCDDPKRYYDAAQRHLWAYGDGEKIDPESGHHHLGHAAWCCLAALWMEMTREESDT